MKANACPSHWHQTSAKLILMDEPTQGLAPALVRHIREIITEVRRLGITVLLVEQNARMTLSVCDRGYILTPSTLRYYWRQWDRRQLRLMQPTLLLGILAGSWALSGLSDLALKKTIGGAALGGALVQLAVLCGWLSLGRAHSHWTVGSFLGLLAGGASAVAHAGGIILGASSP